MYSIAETAKANGLNPYWYMKHVQISGWFAADMDSAFCAGRYALILADMAVDRSSVYPDVC